jgi:pyrroline-5-carboxylate reductase
MSSASSPRYGFVGVGTMSSAIVRGLCTLPAPPLAVVLSPRGADKAAALAGEFPSICTIAESNQQVVDQCDIVFVGVLPKQAEEVLRTLTFSERHVVVSLVSTAQLALLQEVCAPVPVAQVVRAIPLPPVAKHNGATVMTPPHAAVVSLFDSLGTVVPVATEEQMKKMMPVTALMGQFYAQQRATQRWLQANGVDPAAAAKWTGAVFHCVSYDSAEPDVHTFDHLVDEQTPGGLNEQVTHTLT